MDKRVKLSKKQLEVITAIQTQKAEVNKQAQEVLSKEALLMSMVLDFNGIEEAVEKAVLEGEFLVLTFGDKKVSKAKRPITDPE